MLQRRRGISLVINLIFISVKKFTSILLTILFSLSAMGIQITVHHCQDKTTYTFIGIDFNKHCKCKHETENHQSKCCKNQSITLKAPTDPYVSPAQTIPIQSAPSATLFVQAQNFSFTPLLQPTNSIALCDEPPLRDVPLNTLFCVYRI